MMKFRKRVLAFILINLLLFNHLSMFAYAEDSSDSSDNNYPILDIKREVWKCDKNKNLITKINSGDSLEFDPSLDANNTYAVKYIITPPPVSDEYFNETEPKKIAIVVDASTSMADPMNNPYGSDNRRIGVVKKVLNNFLDKIPTSDALDIKLSIYTFGEYADKLKSMSKFDKVQDKNIIDHITIPNNTGTNLADGLRRAYYSLGGSQVMELNNDNILDDNTSDLPENIDEYLILLTDGAPTYHLHHTDGAFETRQDYFSNFKSRGYNVFYSSERYWQTGSGTEYYKNIDKSVLPAKNIARHLRVFENSYFIYLGNEDDLTDEYEDVQYNRFDLLKKIANEYVEPAQNKIDCVSAANASDLEAVYDEILNQIFSDVFLSAIEINDQFVTAFDFEDEELVDEFNKFKFTIPKIQYTRNSSGQFVADPIEKVFYFDITVPGTYKDLSDNPNINFKYLDFSNNVVGAIPLLNENFEFTLNMPAVQNVSANRNLIKNTYNDVKLQSNDVTLSWDAYKGATSYKIYKNNILVKEVAPIFDGTNQKLVQSINLLISESEGDDSNYSVQAVGKISGVDYVSNMSSLVYCDVKPSVLNVKVYRENGEFILAWDEIKNNTINYEITPYIDDVAQTALPISASNLELINGKHRVKIPYSTLNLTAYADDYSHMIDFKIDGKKNMNIELYENRSDKLRIKELVVASINPFSIPYAQNKAAIIKIQNTDIPADIKIWNPAIKIELDLPENVNIKGTNYNNPFKYSYPMIKLENETADSRVQKEKNTFIIELDKDEYYHNENELIVNFDFALGFDTEDINLTNSIILLMKDINPSYDYKAYDIQHNIETILVQLGVVGDIKVRASFMYNNTYKMNSNSNHRDNEIGIHSIEVDLKNVIEASDEY